MQKRTISVDGIQMVPGKMLWIPVHIENLENERGLLVWWKFKRRGELKKSPHVTQLRIMCEEARSEIMPDLDDEPGELLLLATTEERPGWVHIRVWKNRNAEGVNYRAVKSGSAGYFSYVADELLKAWLGWTNDKAYKARSIYITVMKPLLPEEDDRKAKKG